METNTTESEKHYNSLISLLKYGITIATVCITLVFGVAAFLLFQDRKEMKKDLSEIRENYEQKLNIELKKTESQINQLKSDARTIALEEAKIQIKEAFRKDNITDLISSAAKYEVTNRLDDLIDQQIQTQSNILEKHLDQRVQIVTAGMRMRIGVLNGLFQLQHLQKKADTPELRELAKETYDQISADWELWGYNTIDRTGNYREVFKILFGITFNANTPIEIQLFQIINDDENLDKICLSIFYLRKVTGENFKMFDINGIKNWMDLNKTEILNRP